MHGQEALCVGPCYAQDRHSLASTPALLKSSPLCPSPAPPPTPSASCLLQLPTLRSPLPPACPAPQAAATFACGPRLVRQPPSSRYLRQWAQLEKRAGHWDAALELLQRAARANPQAGA